MDVVAFGVSLDGPTLGFIALLVAAAAFGAALDGSSLGAVGAFLVAVEASGAALDGMGLALEDKVVDESSPQEPGREPADAGDETTSSACGLFIVIVASLSLGSLDDPDETGISVETLKIVEGAAADAAPTGDFSRSTGDDI